MSDPALGFTMLALIVVVIMMGFPTAFTLMGLGIFFGFYAYYDPAEAWADNRIFDLMVQRTYGAMTNDVLISIPLFVLMGYVMERGALVEKMFYSIQLAARRVPASLAVATLFICTFWGIASGLVGAVVVLMGVIAMSPMLRAGYDVRLASGVITAGGTLGILIPPSVMIIVYAAVAGESVVRLYAAAMLPGFFLAFLYVVYVLGWATISPRIAPPLPPEQTVVPVPEWLRRFQAAYSKNVVVALVLALFAPSKAAAIEAEGGRVSYWLLLKSFCIALVPLALTAVAFGIAWWYAVIHQQASAVVVPEGLQQLGAQAPGPSPAVESEQPSNFYFWFSIAVAAAALALIRYYSRMTVERFQLLKLLSASMLPLGILTVVVLAVILFGITTATESAAVGAAGAFLLALTLRLATAARGAAGTAERTLGAATTTGATGGTGTRRTAGTAAAGGAEAGTSAAGRTTATGRCTGTGATGRAGAATGTAGPPGPPGPPGRPGRRDARRRRTAGPSASSRGSVAACRDVHWRPAVHRCDQERRRRGRPAASGGRSAPGAPPGAGAGRRPMPWDGANGLLPGRGAPGRGVAGRGAAVVSSVAGCRAAGAAGWDTGAGRSCRCLLGRRLGGGSLHGLRRRARQAGTGAGGRTDGRPRWSALVAGAAASARAGPPRRLQLPSWPAPSWRPWPRPGAFSSAP